MPEPKCVMTAVLLHESGPVNSSLLLILGSHRIGMTNEVKPEKGATSYTVMEIDKNQVSDLAERHGIEAIIGKPKGWHTSIATWFMEVRQTLAHCQGRFCRSITIPSTTNLPEETIEPGFTTIRTVRPC